MIALKLRTKLDDTLACFRIVGAEDEIMLSTEQVNKNAHCRQLYQLLWMVSRHEHA